MACSTHIYRIYLVVQVALCPLRILCRKEFVSYSHKLANI